MKTNYWTTRDGQQIAVEDLGAEHLLNILHMIKRNNQDMYHMRISDCVEENREQLNLILGKHTYIQVMSVREKLLYDMMAEIDWLRQEYEHGYADEWDYILQS
jgi:hypothetical protein|tara:strand:+ start:559 stop:867 length:309 start_codon:yes stop_codon:yes gene_type:complete